MNILFLYNKENGQFNTLVENIIERSEDKDYVKYKIKCAIKKASKTVFDIYIILSDDSQEIYKYIKNTDINKIIIITSKLDTKHILDCINLAKDVIYVKKETGYILDKVIKRYISNEKDN